MNSRILAVACSILLIAAACKKNQKDLAADTALAGTTPTNCNTCGQTKTYVYFAADTIINGTLNLCPDKTYVLTGKMWINNGGKIVIPAGTVIKGRKSATPATASALVVLKGGKIEASGDTTCPVIFTSETDTATKTPVAGDWGGVVILGKSKVNTGTGNSIEGINGANVPAGLDITYGGTDTSDNSGWLKFVRIQYAGAIVSTDNELNGLTCGGVGCGTTLDHVEVLHGADDGFEFFGGTVNGKYLLSVSNNDDQFDFDLGYRGNLQYIVGIVANKAANWYANNNTNGIESDNAPATADPANKFPFTRPVISNMTLVGPENCTAQNPAILNALRFRNYSRFMIKNSIIYNFPTGARLETGTPATVKFDSCGSKIDSSYFYNNLIIGCTATYAGWVTDPLYQTLAGNSNANIGIRNANSYSAFFSSALRGLEPNAAPANTGASFCALTPTNCGFTYNSSSSRRGGAVDANGKYWLSEAWVASN